MLDLAMISIEELMNTIREKQDLQIFINLGN